MDLSGILKAYRVRHELTQKLVSDAIGVSLPAYIAIERGDATPSVPTLKRLAIFFSLTPEQVCAYVMSVRADPSGPKTNRRPVRQRAETLVA